MDLLNKLVVVVVVVAAAAAVVVVVVVVAIVVVNRTITCRCHKGNVKYDTTNVLFVILYYYHEIFL